MRRLLSRTSITLDEAVSILLGQSVDPIDFEPLDEAENAEANRPIFCLQETLDDELDLFVDEHDVTNYEKDPTQVTPEKRAVLERHEAIVNQANVHRCAIRDELNKGERSVLKVDSALSNAVYTFITLHSFNEWRNRVGPTTIGRQSGGIDPTGSGEIGPDTVTKPKSPKKASIQDDAILAEIARRGHNPLAFPKNLPGKRGEASDIRDALDGQPPFEAPSAFKATWERLRRRKQIIDRS